MTDEDAGKLRERVAPLHQPTTGSDTGCSAALPAFTGPDSRCIKCGARAAATTYRAANEHAGTLLRVEHLERQCTRCSYRWPEATIDTIPPARAQQKGVPHAHP